MAGLVTKCDQSIIAVLLLFCLAMLPSTETYAQQGIDLPPMADTRSDTGVSFDSGSFSYRKVDISIGGGEEEGGLIMERQYLSSLRIAFSSGYKSQGWTHNLYSTISVSKLPTSGRPPPPGRDPYLYSISFGDHSVGFLGGSYNPTGGLVGTYTPIFGGGETLTYTGTEQAGTFTFTDKDGSIIIINNLKITSWERPNGVKRSYYYDSSGTLRSIFSNSGYALLFEGSGKWSKVCAVNLAETYVGPLDACPPTANYVTYGYGSSGLYLETATSRNGDTETYQYSPLGGASRLSCVKLPAQGVCLISNQYNVCQRDPVLTQDPPGLHNLDQVVSQTTAIGQTYTYSFNPNPICPRQSQSGGGASLSINGVFSQSVITNGSGLVTSSTDGLNRTTARTYSTALYGLYKPSPLSITFPEQNQTQYGYGPRLNLNLRRDVAKPGSGLADIVQSATYPACTQPKTCNLPASFTDANGNTRAFTYDPNSGGILTQVDAPVAGISPAARYSYVQRFAWLSNGTGGYAQAPSPIWLLSEMRKCRGSALDLINGTCAAGSSDLIITVYDYGPDTGAVGNNLRTRGRTVTAEDADGVIRTYRTCFGYDASGNKIWETSARAGLTSCS